MPAVLLAPEQTPLTDLLAEQLRSDGWTVLTAGSAATDPVTVDAVVYDPALFGSAPRLDAAAELLGLVESCRLRPRDEGGAAVVAIGSRDQLGSGERPQVAAVAGALASAVRSLALRLAPDGVTVNLIAPQLIDTGSQPSNSVRGLLPEPVSLSDIASTAAFLIDPRSRYVTGQVLFCCAGASLLSSLSV